MSGIDVTIELPENETPGELIKGYFTLMRAFGWDLYVTCHFALKEQLGANWFAARISELKDSDAKNWHPNHKFEPQDPGVILRDYVHENDSPYSAVFGGEFQKYSAAKRILGTRNTWFHFGDDPTAVELVEAAKTVRGFVLSSGMHIGARIDVLIARLNDLSTGRYPYEVTPSSSLTTTERTPTQQLDAPADLARPSIGGTWLGAIPAGRFRITKAGDVVNPETMDSIRDLVAGDFAEKLRAWTAIAPRGREVWVDSDGAVGGFIGPSPRLLGYLGPDPEGEVARGFFMPHFYEADGNEIVDVESGDRLTSAIAANVAPGATLRITSYGDVIDVSNADGIVRVASVTPGDWFTGHLA